MYLAHYDGYLGKGPNLEAAFEDLKNGYGEGLIVGETKFYNAQEIDVEMKLVPKAPDLDVKLSKSRHNTGIY